MKGLTDLEEVFAEFINTKRVIDVFSSIIKNNISGWEVWLQIEFAHFLTTEKKDVNWHREYEITSLSEDKSKSRPDFWIWSKSNKMYFLIEFKQRKEQRTLLNAMRVDLKKTCEPKMTCTSDQNVYDFAGQLFIGIYQESDDSKLSLNGRNLLELKSIHGSKFKYFIFHREVK